MRGHQLIRVEAMRTLIFVLYLKITAANLFFSPPIASDETLSVMTITDASDEVFVVGENMIYKLSANLSQLINVTVAVSNDSSVRVRGLSVSNGGQYIVACLTTGSCIGYDVINLNRTMSSVPLNQPEMLTGDDPVVMLPGVAEGSVYTGTALAVSQVQEYPMSLGQYSISSGSIMANTTRDYTLRRSGDFNTRIFKAGFNVDNFTYYIVEDDGTDIRILRVCNSATDMFQGLYEVQLRCDQSTTVFAGASILSNLPNSTNTLVLTVRSPDTESARSGRVCTYIISDINTAMENGRIACAAGENREAIWDNFIASYQAACTVATTCSLVAGSLSLNAIRGDTVALSDPRSPLVIEVLNNQFSEFTSSVIVPVEGELLIFIGTSNGLLLKYNFVNQNLSNPERYNAATITDTSITSLQWSLGSDYVYGLTSRQVIAILVEDCESFRECTSCTGLRDPLCGWCSIEKKCSRRSECSNNNETRRWIQDQTMCIANFAISPNTHPVELINQQFIITADRLPPPLDDESYYCVFEDLGSSLLEGNLIPGVNFTDLTCNYSFIVEQFSNESDDTAVVDFSLRSNLTNINFVTIDDGFELFSCSSHPGCHSCLSSNNLCGWCLYDKKCTSSSDQCRISTDWINTDNSNSTECPLILVLNSTAIGFPQPVGLHNLFLNAINLPAPNENYTYLCVISYNGLTSVIQTEYTGPNDGLVCITRENDFMQVVYVNDASVSVLWIGPDVRYYLETEVAPITITLYNCSDFGGVCSSCLSVSNILSLDCGWCHDSRSCVVTESCSASSTFTANSSDTCPLPQITMVNPNSGPYQGGTNVTITVTNLGMVFEIINSVNIGGMSCLIDRNSYQPGVGLNCVTDKSSARSYVNVTIAIIRFVSIASAVLNDGFRYAEVIITDFNPKRIPLSGNITITIFGNNFNISNPVLARIRLAETFCEINQKTMNNTFVQCVAGSRPRRGTGVVVFSIDNSVTESEVDFTFTDDPQVISLTPNNVIRSGGIKVIFSGSDLDVVPIILVIDIVDVGYTTDSTDVGYTTDSTDVGCTTDSTDVGYTTDSTDVVLTYNVDCTAESDDKLSCTFPTIPTEEVDDIINGMLQLNYSLVAANVPDLDNLHLMSQFVIDLVDDPMVFNLSEIVSYEAGSNRPITIHGMNIDVVNETEVLITVGDRSCDVITYSTTVISCIPPQSGSGTLNIVVYMGENLNYTVGSLRYSSGSDTNNDNSTTNNNNTSTSNVISSTNINTSTNNDDSITTTNVLIIIIITAILLFGIITIVIIIISFCIVKKKSRKPTSSFSDNAADINMYASPAYGTHHVFAESGMDHLYEPIHDYLHEEDSTTLQDATPAAANDGETDVEGHLNMKLSSEVVDQAVDQASVGNTESYTMNDTNDEYVQAADDNLPTATNESDEDDGYENDDQKKNDYLQLKDDHEEDIDFKEVS